MFVDAEDYQTYTRLLALVVERHGWHLLCYCLMPNHIHLMVETPEANLGAGMQWLQSRYVRAFNDRHHRTGALFERRYKSPMVTSDEALVRLVGYIVGNPIAAGLCKRALDWPWSSHATFANGGSAPAWIAHQRLVDYVEGATGSSCYLEIVAAAERRALSPLANCVSKGSG